MPNSLSNLNHHSHVDEPKSLGDAAIRAHRLTQLSASHIAPLTAFVEDLRSQQDLTDEIPNFDPFDGGTLAECLFLLEAPGSRAVKSGFISRNNPDETAKNFFTFNRHAGLDRRRTVVWNIVPWYVGTGQKIRPVTLNDIRDAEPALRSLLPLLPNLKVVVLVGQKAARAETLLRRFNPVLRIIQIPHPSPLFVNRFPKNKSLLHTAFAEVVAAINDASIVR
ncbi:uracil-DNA glycosylase [Nitrosospira sp. Nsp5]|uniref:Uracil-DNA glycosylase n=1 Tax=Nitrosospira multiformis TaxID=1231 RepID=A0ABY0TDF5_9PROT|nr:MULTISPECIES: uracil-DNA glycosylase [Nitrosospira]PTR05364.1 uracil-DNA glycosylase [Nitrosospira sp. Nsp5]SDQ66273.1 Uracil-DNA glycosylase [Nitrosospira multiformis]